MFDDETQKLLAVQAAQTEQMNSAITNTALKLARFRAGLIAGGFTTDRAEEMCADWFNFLLTEASDDD